MRWIMVKLAPPLSNDFDKILLINRMQVYFYSCVKSKVELSDKKCCKSLGMCFGNDLNFRQLLYNENKI